MENACKFSPADQPIEIKAWATERSITLSVTDHGPGIPEGQEEHIFEKLVRFQQGEARPGAGLGLAICKASSRPTVARSWPAPGLWAEPSSW